MDQKTALSRLRFAIGDPPTQGQGCVYDYTLGMELEDALTRLFRKLECRMVSQPSMLALQEGIGTYPLPPDVMRVLTVRIGDNNFLLPDSVYRWMRDSVNWQTAEPSTPGRFAQESRNLIVYPPPDADTIDGSPYLALFYLGNSPGMQALGVPGITEGDMLAAIADAAVKLDGKIVPKDEQEAALQQKRMAVNQGLYEENVHFSLRDWQQPVKMHKPRMSIGGRWARWTR